MARELNASLCRRSCNSAGGTTAFLVLGCGGARSAASAKYNGSRGCHDPPLRRIVDGLPSSLSSCATIPPLRRVVDGRDAAQRHEEHGLSHPAIPGCGGGCGGPRVQTRGLYHGGGHISGGLVHRLFLAQPCHTPPQAALNSVSGVSVGREAGFQRGTLAADPSGHQLGEQR